MRDPNSRRGRTSRSVRRQVSRSGVRAPRVREKGAKDAETQRRGRANEVAHSRQPSRKSNRVIGASSRKDASVTASSGNVFRDIGFPRGEAEHLRVRSQLMMAIEQLIKERGLTQTRAARLFGVTQPRVSDLVRGRIDLFSIDALVEMLGRAGIGLSILLESRRRPA
jgi:predicted XRE-type DNA-binding protein